MENLQKIKALMELVSVDVHKAVDKGNHSACIRARKNAQKIKVLIQPLRKEIIEEYRKHDSTDN